MSRHHAQGVALGVALGLTSACGLPVKQGVGVAPVRISASSGDAAHLSLDATDGFRINAGVAPAFELADGQVLRFAGHRAADDSLYFAGHLVAPCPSAGSLTGVVRVSVCAPSERVCRSVALPATVTCGA